MTATVELRDVLPDRFRKLVEDGGVLHLRVQTELWESRPVWDRLVYPAIVRVFRLGRAPAARTISITDTSGAAPTPMPDPLPVIVDLGNRDRVTASERYYVHVVATLGTLAERRWTRSATPCSDARRKPTASARSAVWCSARCCR